MPLVALLSTAAIIAAQPVALAVQRDITTSGQMRTLRIMHIERTSTAPSSRTCGHRRLTVSPACLGLLLMRQPPRFYLLHGPDEFASAEYVTGLKEMMGDPSMASLNTMAFDGRTVALPELRSVCDTMPFLTKRRLVLVDGWLTKLLSKGDGDEDDGGTAAPASVKELLAALIAYLPTLPETTALVFVEKTHPASQPRAAQGCRGAALGFDQTI